MVLSAASSTLPDQIPSTMRAAVLYGQGDIRIAEKPVPSPGEGEVLIKVAMCGTCGSDISRVYRPQAPGAPPYGTFTPGHEWTGTVAALGPDVDELSVGQRVAIEAHKGCGRCDNGGSCTSGGDCKSSYCSMTALGLGVCASCDDCGCGLDEDCGAGGRCVDGVCAGGVLLGRGPARRLRRRA